MKAKKLFAALLSASCLTAFLTGNIIPQDYSPIQDLQVNAIFTIDDVPEFNYKPYVEINGNQPYFTDSEITTKAFENYSNLDSLGRCGVAYANICADIMPTEERGEIGSIKPTGWHSIKYDCIDGGYLYNRCHLIGYQLAGENANEKNLITGTRYLNIEGMLPIENAVDDYVEDTDNHVLYRVTPDFDGNNLVADGVQIEAYSVEDNGDGVCCNVYCYNAQPNIEINYATGESSIKSSSVKGDANGDGQFNIRDAAFIARKLADRKANELSDLADYNGDGTVNIRDAAAIARKLVSSKPVTTKATTIPKTTSKTTTTTVKKVTPSGLVTVAISNATYILNTKTKKFHKPGCSSAGKISSENKAGANDRNAIIAAGYEPCKKCNP